MMGVAIFLWVVARARSVAVRIGVQSDTTSTGDGGGYDGQTNTASSVLVGGYDASNSLLGRADDVRIYNRALGASEVAAVAKSGAVKVGASSVDLQRGSTLANGLVGHWTFDGPDVTTVTPTVRATHRLYRQRRARGTRSRQRALALSWE